MRVVLETVEEPQQRFVDHRVVLNRVRELRKLLARRQLTIDKEIRDLEEVALFRELLDRHAAMKEHAFVAVDEGDLALARRGRHEARIECEKSVLLGQVRNAQHVGPERPATHIGDRFLASGQIGELEFLLGHG